MHVGNQLHTHKNQTQCLSLPACEWTQVHVTEGTSTPVRPQPVRNLTGIQLSVSKPPPDSLLMFP